MGRLGGKKTSIIQYYDVTINLACLSCLLGKKAALFDQM